MDVDELRQQLAAMAAGALGKSDRDELAAEVLRILDAFAAMESRGWQLLRTEVDDGAWLWQVVGSEGETLAWSETLLDVVTSAYANAEDKSDG